MLVEGPATGCDHLVGCVVADGYGCEERGVELAAMLVAAFGVEVGGGVKFGFEVEDGVPACAGFKPDVEDVGLFAELFVVAGTATGIFWQER